MLKKIVLSLLIPLLVAVPWVGTTYAAEPVQDIDREGGRLTYGIVTSVGENGFGVDPREGDEVYYLVDDGTRFRRGSFENLEVGMKVGVASRGDGERTAALVILLPQDFEPGGRFAVRARGEVTAVDADAGKFRIQTSRGEELTFFVDRDTRFGGQLEGVDDMQVGWKAAVAGSENEDGKLLAAVVIAGDRPDLARFTGQVTAVDAAAGKFRLVTRQGEQHTFFTDEDTRFGGKLEDLSDLEVGWTAVVGAKQEDSKLVAVMVNAGERPEVEKARGKVSAVDSLAGKIRLETPRGETIILFVDDHTRYGGQLNDLSDLQVGWTAGVGLVEGPEGKSLALWVVAGDAGQFLKARGEITAVDARAGKFRLQTKGGDELTFFVDEHTYYKGQADGIYDLQIGWKAGVTAREGEDGKFYARLVVAGQLHRDGLHRPEGRRGEGHPRGGPLEADPFREPPEG